MIERKGTSLCFYGLIERSTRFAAHLAPVKIWNTIKQEDVDAELMEFLRYVENSTDEAAEVSDSDLIKKVHEKVRSSQKGTAALTRK